MPMPRASAQLASSSPIVRPTTLEPRRPRACARWQLPLDRPRWALSSRHANRPTRQRGRRRRPDPSPTYRQRPSSQQPSLPGARSILIVERRSAPWIGTEQGRAHESDSPDQPPSSTSHRTAEIHPDVPPQSPSVGRLVAVALARRASPRTYHRRPVPPLAGRYPATSIAPSTAAYPGARETGWARQPPRLAEREPALRVTSLPRDQLRSCIRRGGSQTLTPAATERQSGRPRPARRRPPGRRNATNVMWSEPAGQQRREPVLKTDWPRGPSATSGTWVTHRLEVEPEDAASPAPCH